MYLDIWMIVMLVLSFGLCAFMSRRQGFFSGASRTLEALEQQRFIKIDDEGGIKRWTPYDDLPVKKVKARKAK